MPTVSVTNFENDDLLSSRLLSFMASTEQMNMGPETTATNGTKFANFGSMADHDVNGSNSTRSPLHRNSANVNNMTLPERFFNGASNDNTASANGFISGSCTPPLTSVHPSSTLPTTYMRSHNNAPPYSALASPCLSNKMNPGANVQQLLGVPNEYHSLQNSPFYNHYPLNGNIPAPIHRQLGGISPGPIGPLLPNGMSPLTGNSRNGLYQDLSFSLNGSMRTLNPGNGTCPQRELFPIANQNGAQCGSSIFGSGLLMQDRLHYYALAQKHGFIVGDELERVKENSCRSTSQSYGRIAAHFRHRYGETEAKTKATYLQIGVRVPSKDHVSEIVGKGGQKIKLIREETGALITTPGEHEEHVFIIEAPPEIAMRVAHHLTARAQEITQSKLAAGERRRGSTSSQPVNGLESNGFQTGNGSTNSLLANGVSSAGVIPLSSSATNSPLHPSMGVLPATNNGGTLLRSPNITGGLFNQQLSSLPSSPCNAIQTNNGNSLYLGSTGTSGSRVLLARSRISVPQDMVGKIIGTQGSIITTIQKDTGTEIKSPPKEAARGPNATSEFEISAYQGLGLTSNQAAECRVQQAKQLIGHLVMRQLERRASEEIDDTSGSSDEQQRHVSNGNNPPSTVKPATWMWPDVAQMDSKEAREVLDRILAESKNKTRRAKELAAAAAGGSAGPSPTTNGGSMLNMLPGMMNPAESMNNALFESVDGNECSTDLADLNSNGLFSPVNRFVKRNSSTTLVDDNGFARASQAPCSPRNLTGFNLTDPNDLMGSYPHRLSSNRGPDIWSSNGSPLTRHNNQPMCDPLHGYLNTTNASNNLFHSTDSNMLRKQTSLTNGAMKGSGFDDTPSMFNFHETANGLSSGFASGGDLSPTVLLQSAGRLPSDSIHQPLLTRRHSDWVVTGGSDMSSTLRANRATANGQESDSFSNPGGFDFIKALDQLCLSSTENGVLAESLGSHTNSSSTGSHGGVNLSHCPPGFEPVPDNAFASTDCSTDFHDLCGAGNTVGTWSESITNGPTSSLFTSSTDPHTDNSHSTSKFSVLQRIFSGNNLTSVESSLSTATTTHLNSIWSPSSVDNHTNNNIPSDSFTSYFHPSNVLGAEDAGQRDGGNTLDSNVGSASSSSNSGGDLSKCGAIGEGRRRRPIPSPVNEHDSIVPLSVTTSVINSITEVA